MHHETPQELCTKTNSPKGKLSWREIYELQSIEHYTGRGYEHRTVMFPQFYHLR